jgi:hypothetical protein
MRGGICTRGWVTLTALGNFKKLLYLRQIIGRSVEAMPHKRSGQTFFSSPAQLSIQVIELFYSRDKVKEI